jgi:hypothetical protein
VEFLFVIWEGGADASESKREDVMAEMGTYVFDLLGKGKLKGGAPLHGPGEGATVRKRRGKITAVDGPYMETKEVIGGFFVVEADTLDEAVELAKGCPAAAYGGVEVRGMIPMG